MIINIGVNCSNLTGQSTVQLALNVFPVNTRVGSHSGKHLLIFVKLQWADEL